MWYLPLTPMIYEAFTYYDREVLPHKNDDVITPTPCRAHTPHSRPYRTQVCAARSLPTPAFPRGPSSAAWLGRPGRRPL